MAMAMTLQQIQWQLRHYKLSSAANYAWTVLRQKTSAKLHKLSSVEDRGQTDSVTILANRWFSIRGKLPDTYRCKKRLELKVSWFEN